MDYFSTLLFHHLETFVTPNSENLHFPVNFKVLAPKRNLRDVSAASAVNGEGAWLSPDVLKEMWSEN